jgi:hypothetical protein
MRVCPTGRRHEHRDSLPSLNPLLDKRSVSIKRASMQFKTTAERQLSDSGGRYPESARNGTKAARKRIPNAPFKEVITLRWAPGVPTTVLCE